MSTAQPFDRPSPFQTGQRLHCQQCGSEIEIRKSCTCEPPAQVFRCCGQDMVPAEGTPPRLNSE